MTKPLESRRGQGRVAALQFMYEHELNAKEDVAEAMEQQFEYLRIREGIAGYARKLIEGTLSHLQQIDKIIIDHLQNWELSRLSVVDRSVLRIAVYEIIYVSEVPPKVSINEMVEVSKIYGSTDSPGFVNGVIDAILRTIEAKEKE